MSGSNVSFKVTITGFRNLRGQFASLANDIGPSIADAFDSTVAPEVLSELQNASPVNTGELRQAWDYNVESNGGDVDLNFFNETAYIEAVIKGRRPGPIPAEGVANMHFFAASGDEVFIKQGVVMHPGTQPNNFVDDVNNRAGSIALPEIERVLYYSMQRNLVGE